jgi:hypothetical protein
MPEKTLTDLQLNRALLARQMLLKRKRVSVPAAIHAIAGLQTQEPKDAFVALWSRIDKFNPERLRVAAADRSIVRGSNLRCTIHTVTADDFANFRLPLQTVISRDTNQWKQLYTGFEIPDVVAAVRKLLVDDEPRTARQIGEAIQDQFPNAPVEGLAHCARIQVPLVMVPTDDRWGYPRPPKFLLADRWLGKKLASRTPLHDLLLRGISATGPSSSADLRTWSAMPGIKEALEDLRPQLKTFRDSGGRELFDLPDALRPRADTPAPVRFLGEYDNVALSHSGRSRIIDKQHAKLVNFQKNGRRAFAVLVDGFIGASWQIERKKDVAAIRVMPFEKLSKALLDELAAEGERLVRFVEPDATTYKLEFSKPG